MARIHLIGIPHTINTNEYSHCAFTGKTFRFPRMLQKYGYEVIEYSNEGSESGAAQHIPILNAAEFKELKEKYASESPNHPANTDTSLYHLFTSRMVAEVKATAHPGDIIAHPFGFASYALRDALPNCFHVETGIGYNDAWAQFRIYESYAWWHYHQGKENRAGHDYEFVIPNYYDTDEWTVRTEPGTYLLYFGRIQEDKGLRIVKEIAKYTGIDTIICGNGDPTPFLDDSIPNLRYHPPIHGKARDELLGGAIAMLMPTRYTEPFGGAGVEGTLCGTPLIASDFGAFSETTDYRAKTLADWVRYIEFFTRNSYDQVSHMRHLTAVQARRKYSLETVGLQYANAFRQILNLQDKGWYQM